MSVCSDATISANSAILICLFALCLYFLRFNCEILCTIGLVLQYVHDFAPEMSWAHASSSRTLSQGASSSRTLNQGASTSRATSQSASTSWVASRGASTSRAASRGASTSWAASRGASGSQASSQGASGSRALSQGASDSRASSRGPSSSRAFTLSYPTSRTMTVSEQPSGPVSLIIFEEVSFESSSICFVFDCSTACVFDLSCNCRRGATKGSPVRSRSYL